MEEIALIFSSVAGACSAVALDKVPKIKRTKQTPTVNFAIINQLHSLRMEKEILLKTIARLHQQESQVSSIQKDKLLLRYQHQLGTVISKIEKLELASKYPDLGPVGDSLISLMDNRLSQLDQRLHEISAKITISSTQTKQIEKPIEVLEKVQANKIEPKVESQIENIPVQKQKVEIQSEKTQEWLPPIEVPTYEKHRIVELSTLTEITNKVPQFPAELIRPAIQIDPQIPEKIVESEVIQEPILVPQSNIQEIKEIIPELIIKPEVVQQEPEKKIQLPAAIKIPEEEKLEDDDKDLDKIKSEIMKALSKLEQVEVE
jgi:hypothetical protein